MSEIRWGAYDSIQTALSTGLDSLANGSLAISSAIDFTASGTDRKQYMDLEFNLASIDLSSQADPAVFIWLLARTDGTNFEDGGTSTEPARAADKVIPLRAVSAGQRVSARLLVTTPDQGKLLLKNATGVAFASSGSTLKYYTYGEEII